MSSQALAHYPPFTMLEGVGIGAGDHRVEHRRLGVVNRAAGKRDGRPGVLLGAIGLPCRAGRVLLGSTVCPTPMSTRWLRADPEQGPTHSAADHVVHDACCASHEDRRMSCGWGNMCMYAPAHAQGRPGYGLCTPA